MTISINSSVRDEGGTPGSMSPFVMGMIVFVGVTLFMFFCLIPLFFGYRSRCVRPISPVDDVEQQNAAAEEEKPKKPSAVKLDPSLVKETTVSALFLANVLSCSNEPPTFVSSVLTAICSCS